MENLDASQVEAAPRPYTSIPPTPPPAATPTPQSTQVPASQAHREPEGLVGGVGWRKRPQLTTKEVCCSRASVDPQSPRAPALAPAHPHVLRASGRRRAEGGAGARPGGHVTGGAGIKPLGSCSPPELVLRPRPSV